MDTNGDYFLTASDVLRIINYLNEVGISARGSARGNVPGTDQRHSMIYASTVDLEEAYRVGQKAAQIGADEGSGFMSTILREPGPIYNVRYDKVPLPEVANSERTFPAEWITPDYYTCEWGDSACGGMPCPPNDLWVAINPTDFRNSATCCACMLVEGPRGSVTVETLLSREPPC